MLTTNMDRLTVPGVEAWIDEEAKLYKPMFTKLFTLETTSRLYEDESSFSGIDFPEEVAENAASPESSFSLGYTWRYEQKVFKRKVAVSKLLEKTDLYGIISAEKNSRALAQVAAQGRDVNAFSVFRKAFDSTVTYGDGVSLVSVAHPRKSGSAVQRNTFLDGVQRVLSYDNAKLLEDVLIEVYSNSDIPLDVAMNNRLVLMVPPYLRESALQIAECEKIPGTADESINYFKGRNFDVLVNPYISWRFAYKMGETASTDRTTFDKRWFLIDPSFASKILKFKQIQDFEVNAWEDYDTDTMYAKVADVYAVGTSGWVGVGGSLGDASTLTT